MVPHQGTSGGETSSDEGEPIPSHAIHQYPPPQINADSESSRAYHMPMLVAGDDSKVINDGRLISSRFGQQRIDYGRHERPGDPVEESPSAEENSHPYKCQICTISLRTINELQVHCFVEHNIESQGNIANIHPDGREKDSNTRMSEEMSIVRNDPSRRRSDDT